MFPKPGIFCNIILYKMNKMQAVAERDTSYTLSLFASKFAFEIKVHIKIQKTYIRQFYPVFAGLANLDHGNSPCFRDINHVGVKSTGDAP